MGASGEDPEGPARAARVVTSALPPLLFALFLITAAPGLEWLDGGELVASGWDLGVSHPPGQPLPSLLWRLAMLLPLGSIPFRATVATCVLAAAAAVPLIGLARILGADLRHGNAFVVAACTGSLLGFAPWTQAVRPEVYAPQLTLALLLLALATSAESSPRRVAAIGALMALSGATHPLLAVGLLPAAVFALACAGRRAMGRGAGAGIVATAAVASLYLYLPLRSLARPDLAWGTPHTPSAFVAVVTGQTFAHNFSPTDGSMFAHNLRVLVEVMVADLGLAPFALALVGFVLLVRRGSGRLAVIVGLAVAGNVGTVLLQNKVFASNPDLHGYVALTTVLLALTATYALFVGLDTVARRLAHRTPLVDALAWLVVVAFCLAAVPVGLNVDRSRNWLAELHARAQIDGLPAGSVLVTSGNSAAFAGWGLARLERRRPDLVVFHRALLGHPFYEHQLRLNHGDPPGDVDTVALRGDVRATLGVEGRVTAVEIREPDLMWARQLAPAGRVMRLYPGDVDLDSRLADHHELLRRWAPDPADPTFLGDPEAVGVALYEDLLRASFFDLRGRPDLVDAELDRIGRFAPGSIEELPRPADASWWRQR